MSTQNVIGQEASQVEQPVSAVVEETPELRPSVEQEIQGKVDTNHPEVRGLTLAAEERMQAREWELERTRVRFDARQDSDREVRTRRVAGRVSDERRLAFERRAASVDPWRDPDRVDARAQLSRVELAEVNREAARLAGKLEGWSRAAISRLVAERVAEGASIESAVFEVFERLLQGPGQVIPISAVARVDRGEVSVEGEITTLWEPSHPAIAQVGLIEDDSGRIKFTSWKKSNARFVEEGEYVQLRDVKKSWYDGRCSVAVTGWSDVKVADRGRWWE